MTLTEISPPTTTPLSVAELGDHLRLAFGFGAEGAPNAGEGSLDDPALERALRTATTAIERDLSIALLRQTWDWRFRRWAPVAGAPFAVRPPIAPVLRVVSIESVDVDGGATAWSSTDWRLTPTADGAAIEALGTDRWTSSDSYVVRFEAGYGDAPTDCPSDLRQAVALLAAHYFERREASTEARLNATPLGVERLLAPHRRRRF